MAHAISPEMQDCIRNCIDCTRACRETLAYCLSKGGKHVAESHIRLLMDCAEACDMSASMMLRGSEFHARHCALCAEICKACEESCEEFAGDATMKACEDACRRCFESCRRMEQDARAAAESATGLHA